VSGQLGYSYSYSESQSLDYQKNATNETGFTTATNFSYSQSISWNSSGSFSTGPFSLSPSYSYNYSLSRAHKTNAWDLNSRNRNISLSMNLPKILILTPSMNYNINYAESGFHYKGERKERKYENYDKDPNLYKNATTSQSFTPSIGSFNLDWFMFKSFTPSYSQSMGFSQSDISAVSNSMLQTFNKFADPFLLRVPGYYFYIPYVNPHFRVFDFVRQFKDAKYQNSLSYGNSFSAWLGLYFFEWSQWSLSYSLSQNASRSYSSYSISHSWSFSASSSLDLMKIFNFWIWRQNSDFVKSSAISYGLSYRRNNSFQQLARDETYSPSLSFSYRWKSDKSISWSLSYSYSINQYEEFKSFYDLLEKDYSKQFRDELRPNVQKFQPKIGQTWSFSTSYSYSTDLAEYWKPPLFFKKPIHLGFKISHSDTLSFARTTYDYGKDEAQNDIIHPKEMVHQFSLSHSMSFTISKNIDGGGSAKLVYEKTREELGKPGDDQDDKEQVFSWEVGINATIRF
ncbi:MAG: hypothetical protein PHF84_05945, partial [bacterium]|nr:hypothetical protein [bacterium]